MFGGGNAAHDRLYGGYILTTGEGVDHVVIGGGAGLMGAPRSTNTYCNITLDERSGKISARLKKELAHSLFSLES